MIMNAMLLYMLKNLFVMLCVYISSQCKKY